MLQLSSTKSLANMVNTMHQLSATTTFEELRQAASSITAVVGNLLQVSILACLAWLVLARHYMFCRCQGFDDLST